MVEKEHVLGKWRHSLTPRGGVRLPCDKARLPCDVRDCHAKKKAPGEGLLKIVIQGRLGCRFSSIL